MSSKYEIDIKSLTKLPKRFLVEIEDDKTVVIVSTKINQSEIHSDKKWDNVSKVIKDWAKLNHLEEISTGTCLADMQRDWYLRKNRNAMWLDAYTELKNKVLQKIGYYYKKLNYDNFPVKCNDYTFVISYYNDFSGEWVNFKPASFTDFMIKDNEDNQHELDDINLIDLCTFLDYLAEKYLIRGNTVIERD